MNTESTVNTETISEQAMWKNTVICVLGILLSLVMLCSTTFAWFTTQEQSDTNTLMSGHFDLSASLVRLSDTDLEPAFEVAPDRINEKSGAYYYTLPRGTYQITLTLGATATAKGFCIVDIGDVQHITETIVGENTSNKDGFAISSPYVFNIQLEADVTVLSLHPHWGIPASPTLKNNANEPSALS